MPLMEKKDWVSFFAKVELFIFCFCFILFRVFKFFTLIFKKLKNCDSVPLILKIILKTLIIIFLKYSHTQFFSHKIYFVSITDFLLQISIIKIITLYNYYLMFLLLSFNKNEK